jgi:hypothetical protein
MLNTGSRDVSAIAIINARPVPQRLRLVPASILQSESAIGSEVMFLDGTTFSHRLLQQEGKDCASFSRP